MGEYSKVTFRGRTTDQRTATMARLVEKRLGITFVCYQGSYNGTVDASGGTHDGGGALDLNVPGDPGKITRALRNQGFAAWYRTPAQGFDTHIHAIDIGNRRLSFNAGLQVGNYGSTGDGLWPLVAGDDPQPYRPTKATYAPYTDRDGFDYEAWDKARTLASRIKDRAARVRHLLRLQRRDRKKLDRLS